MRIVGVIPARFGSTRFPGKPLALIAGKPLIRHVIERCIEAAYLDEVVVATDDQRIADVAAPLCAVEITRPDHATGTDRIAEVAARRGADGYVNIQGDEPLMDPGVIDAVARLLGEAPMTTAATPLHCWRDLADPNVVKVVIDRLGRALYFSRHSVPYLRELPEPAPTSPREVFPFLRHLGIYGYRQATLERLVALPESSLERAERLEQLRALENGISIAVAQVAHEAVGVDVPADVARVEALLHRGSGGGR